MSTPIQLQPVEREPALRHRVHEQLEQLIVTGAVEPGSRLIEADLAETLGVSRGPIREALQRLARDGFVDLQHRQGAFVHVPTAKEVDDFFDIRRALECESARLAARRITPEGAERLQASFKRGEEKLKSGRDPSRDTKERLHDLILAIADNEVLEQLLETINKRSVWYLSPFEPDRRRKAWDEHRAILDAIVSGDEDGAVQAMAEHVESARAAYKALATGDATTEYQ